MAVTESKKDKAPAVLPRLMSGRLCVEESRRCGSAREKTLMLTRGLEADETPFAVFYDIPGEVIHLVRDGKPTRSVSISSLVESLLHARPQRQSRRET